VEAAFLMIVILMTIPLLTLNERAFDT
jgi:hypothetical protein